MAEFDAVAALAKLESDLGIPEGFVFNLTNEDDWSFVVKTYALIEAALTQLLLTVIDRPKIEEQLALLPMRTKLALAESLELLDGRERACIQALTNIRNKLAHNISHVQFDLSAYFKSLSKGLLRQCASEFHPYRTDDRFIEIDGSKYSADTIREATLTALPKRGIHESMVLLVSAVAQRKQLEAMLAAHNISVQEFANRLMRPYVLEGLRKAIERSPSDPSSV